MDRYDSQIIRIDGDQKFIEIVNSMMDKGILQMNFCEYNKSNQMTCCLPFYLSKEDSLALAIELVNDTLKTRSARKDTYWLSCGGSDNTTSLKKWCPWITDKMHVTRKFSVGASTKGEYLLKCEYGIGHKDGNLSIMDEVKKYVMLPITWQNAKAIGLCILEEWQTYNTVKKLKYSENLWNMELNIFEPDNPKENTKGKNESSKDKATLEEIQGYFMTRGDFEQNGELFKLSVVEELSGELGEMLFYPNQIKKCLDKFEKLKGFIKSKPEGARILLAYSKKETSDSSAFIFKNFCK